ncbi:MAG: hypothetical protein IJQ67_01005 [Bacilli bacterium]|nr:hypothetical protein [Bacilli bacterium]
MVFYLIVIAVTLAATSLLNIFFNPMHEAWWVYLVATFGAALVCFLLDALVAIIIRKMPEKYFQKDKGIFHTSEKELRFYRAIGVQKWKDYIPELGGFTNFHKDKVLNPFDNEYIAHFILEARYGIAIHIYSVPASFLVILLDYRMYMGQSNLFLTIALPIAFVNAILIVLPAFILKYNLPRLLRIYEGNLKMKEKNRT